MCKYMSFIITKDALLGLNTTDHHEDLIKYFGLDDTRPLDRRSFVRVECIPTDDGWKYSVDEIGTLPKWYNAKNSEKRVITAARSRLRGLRSKMAMGESLTDADLSGADLNYANLIDANLNYANLTDANLRSANLTDANLSGANLIDANLNYANLTDANLRSANLIGQDIKDLKSRGAIL